MKYIVAVLFFLFVVQQKVSAKQMDVLSYSRVQLNGNIYDFYKSEALLKTDAQAYPSYLKSKKGKNTSKILGMSSIGSLGLGIVLISAFRHRGYCDTICFTGGQTIGGFLILIVFPVTGTTGIVTNIISKARFRKAVDIYNLNHPIGYNRKTLDLSLGLTQNGVGFTLTF